MNLNSIRTIIGASLLATASLAQANATDASFIDVANSVSFDGWNQLNRTRLTAADLATGTASNVAGSGDAILTLLSGPYYPAGSGLYSGGSQASNFLTFIDNTVASNITSIVFQGLINNFANPFSLELNLLDSNGSHAGIVATTMEQTDNYYYYTWDLSGFSSPITSYTLNFNIGFSQSLAFQIDQVAAVPEPSTYAMLMLGLGAVGFAARRRSSKFHA